MDTRKRGFHDSIEYQVDGTHSYKKKNLDQYSISGVSPSIALNAKNVTGRSSIPIALITSQTDYSNPAHISPSSSTQSVYPVITHPSSNEDAASSRNDNSALRSSESITSKGDNWNSGLPNNYVQDYMRSVDSSFSNPNTSIITPTGERDPVDNYLIYDPQQYPLISKKDLSISTKRQYEFRQISFIAWCVRNNIWRAVDAALIVQYITDVHEHRPISVGKNDSSSQNEPISSVGHSTHKMIVYALEELHTIQKIRNPNIPPMDTQLTKAFLACAKRNKEPMRSRENGAPSFSGYTIKQYRRVCSNIWKQQSLADMGDSLRVLNDFTTDYYSFWPGVLERDFLMKNLKLFDYSVSSKTPIKAIIYEKFMGNRERNTRVQTFGFVRNKSLKTCPVFALAALLFYRFRVSNEQFPNISGYWDDTKIWKFNKSEQKSQMLRVFEYNRISFIPENFSNSCSYVKFLDLIEVVLSHYMEDQKLISCFTSLSLEFLLGLSDNDPRDPNSYFVPRDEFEPPQELIDQVFPQLKLYRQNELDEDGIKFLELMKFLSRTFLQDCALLKVIMPQHNILRHDLFSSKSFDDFFASIATSLDTEETSSTEFDSPLINEPEMDDLELSPRSAFSATNRDEAATLSAYQPSSDTSTSSIQSLLTEVKTQIVKVVENMEKNQTLQFDRTMEVLNTMRSNLETMQEINRAQRDNFQMLASVVHSSMSSIHLMNPPTNINYPGGGVAAAINIINSGRTSESSTRDNGNDVYDLSVSENSNEAAEVDNDLSYPRNSESAKSKTFRMDRDLVTVHELWREWFVPQAKYNYQSVTSLEEDGNTTWRRAAKDKQFFHVRKYIIDYILKLREENGYSEDMALSIVENIRLNLKHSKGLGVLSAFLRKEVNAGRL